MEKIGLTRDDLAIFGMASVDARLKATDERLRPRLEQVALRFAAPLSRFAGVPLSASIEVPTAESVRPAEVLFFVPGDEGAQKPQFRFSISRGGVHARIAVLREAAGREALSRKLARAASALAKELAGNDLRRYDDWDGRGLPAPSDADRAPFWKEVAERLGRVTGSLDIGLGWPEARAVLLAYEDLLPAWRNLVPLWKRLA